MVLVGLVGCSSSMVYRPPVLTGENDGSTTIELPFDGVWEELIDMLSTSFLSIELLEKDSGFIRLDLRVAHPEDYIDCGHAVYQPPNEEFAFDCPYAQYLNRFRDVQLVGSMNIYVRALDEQTTFVRVHTRYVFGEWVFETGSSHTREIRTGISNPEARTCLPTHRAENLVLESIQGRGSR